MIKQARIRCFQSHRDTTLNFGSGVNIIVGEGNDIGKTAIKRAIELVITNRPLGTNFISNFQDGPTIIDITTDDAHVTRIRGEKENKYVLTHKEYDEESINAGTNPPEMVTEALNFLPVNMQPQLTLPFLVLESPGAIARHIRELANLDDIDKVIQLLKSKKRSKTEQLETSNEHLVEVQAKLKKSSETDIAYFEAHLLDLKRLIEDGKEMLTYANALKPRIAILREIEENKIELPKNIDQLLEKSNKLIAKNDQIRSRIEELSSLISAYKKIKPIYLPENIEKLAGKGDELIDQEALSTQYIEEIENLIAGLKDIQQKEITIPTDLVTKTNRSEKAIEQYNIIEERISSVSSSIKQLVVLDSKESEINRKISNYQKQFDSALAQLTICPTCSSKLTEDTKKKVLKEYKA